MYVSMQKVKRSKKYYLQVCDTIISLSLKYSKGFIYNKFSISSDGRFRLARRSASAS